MPADDSLKRLGGGRWETRDGRFAIEPQSGTWVVVESSQTDDLGLPLVRGPFGSLTAARDAIEAARQAGPAESPLAERIKQAKPSGLAAGDGSRGAAKRGGRTDRTAPEPEPAKPPASAPEPKWLRDLAPAERRQAASLVRRLADLGIDEPDAVVRAEIARDRPALARLALERSLRKLVEDGKHPAATVRATVAAILRGADRELGARWRLVDDKDRRIDELELGD